MNHALHGSQTPTTAFVPSSMGLASSGYFDDGDLLEAKELLNKGLEELGLTKLALNHLKLSYASSDKSHRIAQVLQQQWLEALNIKVDLEALEPKVYFFNLNQKNYDLAISSWFADFNDPINFLEIFADKTHLSNRTAFEDSNLKTLVSLSYKEKDSLNRLKILKQVEQGLLDSMPIIPLSNAQMMYVKKEKVKDVTLSGTGEIDFKWAYIENLQL